MERAEKISLYFSEGSSDKEYHAELKAAPDNAGWLVTFRYGRRGSSLTAGTKTNEPVPFDKAKKIYDKLVAEKMGKGYSTGETGAAYQDSALEQRFTGVVPQLLNPITEEEVMRKLKDPAWGAQEKFDGKRITSNGQGNEVVAANRKGLTVSIQQTIATGVGASKALLDGEMMGDFYVVFDILELNGKDIRNKGYAERYAILQKLAKQPNIKIAELAVGTEAKQALWNKLKKDGREGIVFKKLDAPYTAGRPASGGDQLKYKFVESATVRVAGINKGKRSVAIEMLKDGAWEGVGNVTIPANYAIPAKGAIIEVWYLYAYENGSLYQPQYKGERDDQDEAACVISQLKYKSKEEDEDA